MGFISQQKMLRIGTEYGTRIACGIKVVKIR
jgi:hypothetical protein